MHLRAAGDRAAWQRPSSLGGKNLLVLGSVPEGATEGVTYWPISVLFPLVFTAPLDVDALMLSHLWKHC